MSDCSIRFGEGMTDLVLKCSRIMGKEPGQGIDFAIALLLFRLENEIRHADSYRHKLIKDLELAKALLKIED